MNSAQVLEQCGTAIDAMVDKFQTCVTCFLKQLKHAMDNRWAAGITVIRVRLTICKLWSSSEQNTPYLRVIVRGKLTPVTPAVRRRGSLFPDYLPRVEDTPRKRTTQRLYMRGGRAPKTPGPTLFELEQSLRQCPVCNKATATGRDRTSCKKCLLQVCAGTCSSLKRVPSSMHEANFQTYCTNCVREYNL